MRILFLTQILPYPPNAGPRVKTWNVLRHLAKSGAEITLVTFTRPEELEFLIDVKQVCREVVSVPIKRNRVNDLVYFLKSLFSGNPFLVERDHLQSMDEKIRAVLSEQNFDIIHADQLSMAQYAWMAKLYLQKKSGTQIPRLIFDAHNATWTILDRMQTQVPFFVRPLVRFESVKIKKYEGWLVKKFDRTLAVTEIDRAALLLAVDQPEVIKNKIPVIPIAVDTKQLSVYPNNNQGNSLLTLGTLHYPPNADGIRWFMQKVFPIVLQQFPNSTLTVIGKNPPQDFFVIAQKQPDQIKITGYVEKLDPYLQQARIIVVPVLAGGGMRVRILEAFAHQIAVVTTSIGLEGIEAEHNKNVMIGDSPEEFASAVIHLLTDPELCKSIASNGRKLVESKYDWQAVFGALDEVYQQLTSNIG
jgi:glycosyltransferase involved in cell wall biosynthesis